MGFPLDAHSFLAREKHLALSVLCSKCMSRVPREFQGGVQSEGWEVQVSRSGSVTDSPVGPRITVPVAGPLFSCQAIQGQPVILTAAGVGEPLQTPFVAGRPPRPPSLLKQLSRCICFLFRLGELASLQVP